MNKQYSKDILILNSFILPVVSLAVIFAFSQIKPFGEKAFLMVDMAGQYISYFSYYKQILAGEQSLFYTFSKLIGGDMAGFFAYYLMSPFNLLLLLFPTEHIQSGIIAIVFSKIGVCGITSYIFFSENSRYSFNNLIFSTAYALMAYNIIYAQNIMWLDGVVFLPIIALGIQNISKGKSPALYILALFIAITSQYYIGYMLCGFSVLFWIYTETTKKLELKIILKSAFTFAISSLLAGGMSCFILMPVYTSLQGTTKQSLPLTRLFGMQPLLTFKQLVKHIFIPEITLSDICTYLPAVYTGMAMIILRVCFFFRPKIPLIQRISGGGIIAILILSFYFLNLNYIWHGLAAPVCFNDRFSFIFSFFIIYFAFSFVTQTQLLKNKFLIIALLCVNTASLILYGMSNFLTISWPQYSTFYNYYNTYNPLVETAKELESKNHDFYRMEFDQSYNINNPMMFGYSGMSHYSSGEKLLIRSIPRRMGYTITEGTSYYNDGNTLANDSFWGIKYYINSKVYRYGLEQISNNGGITLSENPYALPLAIKSHSDIIDFDTKYMESETAAQEILTVAMGQQLNLIQYEKSKPHLFNISSNRDSEISSLVHYNLKDSSQLGSIIYEFKADQNSNLYIYIPSDSFNSIETIEYNQNIINDYLNSSNFGILPLGSIEKGQTITIKINLVNNLSCYGIRLFYDDFAGLKKVKQIIDNDGISVTDFKQYKFTISAIVDSDDCGVLLKIPYQDGWTFTWDGKPLDYLNVLGGLIYIPLEKGEYIISAKYIQPLSLEGLVVSISCLLFTIGYIVIYNKNHKNIRKQEISQYTPHSNLHSFIKR